MKTVILLVNWAEPAPRAKASDEEGELSFRAHCIPPIPPEVLANGEIWVIAGYAENEELPWSIVPASKAWEAFVNHAWHGGGPIFGVGVPAHTIEEAEVIKDELQKEQMAQEEYLESVRRAAWKHLGYESLPSARVAIPALLV